MDMKMSNAARRAAIKMINYHLVPSSWECCGGGEITMSLYVYDTKGRKLWVGELSGDNGSNTLYNPEAKPWTESIEDKSDQWLLKTIDLITNNL